jgi:hypothetical protein
MASLDAFAYEILTDASFLQIQNAGVQSAVATLAQQLPTYRSTATAVSCIEIVRDLINDILDGQGGQVDVTQLPPVAYAEGLVSDATAVTALTTIRAYLTGLSTANVPVTGALKSKQAFGTLCALLPQAI